MFVDFFFAMDYSDTLIVTYGLLTKNIILLIVTVR